MVSCHRPPRLPGGERPLRNRHPPAPNLERADRAQRRARTNLVRLSSSRSLTDLEEDPLHYLNLSFAAEQEQESLEDSHHPTDMANPNAGTDLAQPAPQVPPVPVPAPLPQAPSQPFQVLQYHGLPPSPPTLDVDFESCNVRAWEMHLLAMAIRRYARARGIVPAIYGQPSDVPPQAYDSMSLEAESVIHPSITEELLQA